MATSSRRWFALFSALALALVGFVLAGSPAQAAGTTRYVATTGDDTDNDCTDSSQPCATVQHGVDQANAGDTVSIAAGTYHESVRIRQSMTLLGAGTSGAKDTVIDGFDGDPSIFVDGFDTNTPPEVTIQDLDVSGNTDDDGIFVEFATVHVIDCVVSHNDGNGISVLDESTATVVGSDVSDNGNEGIVLDVNRRDVAGRSAAKRDQVLPVATVTNSTVNRNLDGGVIVEEGQADVIDTTLDGNTGAGMVLDGGGTFGSLTTSTASNTKSFSEGQGQEFGGGVLVFPGGQVAIDTSTIFGNVGQGVLAFNGNTTIENSTISGTIAPDEGTEVGGAQDLPYGGIAVDNAVPERTGKALEAVGWSSRNAKRNATVAARADGPQVTVAGTIVADNTELADCNGDIVDDGYNLDSDGSCQLSATGSISEGKAKLGPLANNGGSTRTLYPAKTSDAVDAIPSGSHCSTKSDDQRGVSRPQGKKCDIGAVEADQPPIVIAPNKLPDGKVGKHYHAQLSATGGLGAPYEFSLAPSSEPLPDGLTLHADGKVSGTPTKAGHYPITVSVDDPTLKDYVIVITAPAVPTTPVVTPPTSGGIANTGTPVASLSMTGLLAIVGGVLFLIAAGWIGVRPGRHRGH